MLAEKDFFAILASIAYAHIATVVTAMKLKEAFQNDAFVPDAQISGFGDEVVCHSDRPVPMG